MDDPDFLKLAYIRLVCVATFAMCCHGLCHSSGIYNPDDYIMRDDKRQGILQNQ